MSSASDNDFDLEKLFLPAWAQEPSAAKYAHYEGGEDHTRERRGERRGGRPRRPDDRFGGRRPEGGGRPRGEGGGRPFGGRRDQQWGERPRGEEFRPERRESPPPPPEVNLSLVPDEKGVESLARQIKMTGRAYPLFEIAQMILQKPERHAVVFSVKKNAEGKPVQPLFVCALDDSLWLSEDEAVGHVLKRLLSTFYQAERTATEPPKGKYTFVAQCGMSGVVLGPPNHHDYQNQLRKLHAERYSRMPFEMYKSRVRIVRDEEVVKKWIDDQSWRTEYVCLNQPEPLRLASMEAVEKHFRETHKESIIKQVETHTLPGLAARGLRSPELSRLVRSIVEDQKRFPLQIATTLSQRFAVHGLQFFKVNKTVTHVSVARPHFLDMAATPVSDGIRRIVEYIGANPKCTRRQLVEALAPAPSPAPIPVSPDQGQPPATATPPESQEPTSAQTEVISDLHWLVHQGHVIEFANGTLDTAKRPLPKPPKPAPKEEPSKETVPAVSEPVRQDEPGVAPVEAGSVEAPVAPADAPSGQVSTPQAVAEGAKAEPAGTEPEASPPLVPPSTAETEPVPGPVESGS